MIRAIPESLIASIPVHIDDVAPQKRPVTARDGLLHDAGANGRTTRLGPWPSPPNAPSRLRKPLREHPPDPLDLIGT